MKQFLNIFLLIAILGGCASQMQKESEIEQRELYDQSKLAKQLEFEQQAKEQDDFARQQDAVREQQERLAKQLELDERQAEEFSSAEIVPIEENQLEEAEIDEVADARSQLDQTLLAKRSIFFEYDRFDIAKEFIPIVEAHANHLIRNPEMDIIINGHCDTRGSREYNLALGQRRANSVKRAMLLLGVNDDQVRTVSFGAEKPVANGQDEESHARNRRSDIIYESTMLP